MDMRDKMLLTGLGAFVAGVGAGALGARQILRTRYEEIAEQEIAEAREHYKKKYKQLYKAGEFETPEGAAKALGIDTDGIQELEAAGIKVKLPENEAEARAMVARLATYGPTPATSNPESVWRSLWCGMPEI